MFLIADKYSLYNVLESDNIIDFVFIDNTDKKVGVYIKEDIVIPLTKEEKEKLKIEYDYSKNLSKPVKKDTNLGLIKIYIENNLIFEQKIYTIVNVE